MQGNRNSGQFIIRMPPGMREQVHQKAIENRRSMNAEIIHYIDRALGLKVGAEEDATSPRPVHRDSVAGENHERAE